MMVQSTELLIYSCGAREETTTTPMPSTTPTTTPKPTPTFDTTTETAVRHDVKCGRSDMSFSITLPDDLPLPLRHTLSDPSCPVELTRYTRTLTGRTGLNDCGSTLQLTNDSILFSNTIFLSDNVSAAAQTIPIQCRYSRYSNLTLFYLPVVSRVLFTESGVGQFGFQMQQFHDDTFDKAIDGTSYPMMMRPGEDVYLELALGYGGAKLKGDYGMDVLTCIASDHSSLAQAEEDGDLHTLIQDSCPASPDVRILEHNSGRNRSLPYHFRFAFQTLTFPDSKKDLDHLVYVHCRVKMCAADQCKPAAQCDDQEARIVKRSVRERVQRSAGHQLSAGPFVVTSESQGSSATNTSPLTFTLAAVAIAATLVAMVAVVALVRARARGQGHQHVSVTAVE